MALVVCLTAVFMLFHTTIPHSTVEISERNLSCGDIKMPDGGFNFPHGCPVGAEITVSDNGTIIATDKNTSAVKSMDNNSVITEKCRDLKINCIIHGAGGYVRETQLILRTTEESKKPDPESPPPQRFASGGKSLRIVGGIIGVISVISVISVIIVFCCYKSWQKKQQEDATFVRFCKDLVTHCAPDTGETRGSAIPGDTAVVDMQPGDISLVERPSALEPNGSGGGDAEQGDTLVPLLSVDSIDPGSDSKTPHTRSLDRNEGICPTNNDDAITLSDVIRASNYPTVTRNLRDDPGGADHDEGRCLVRANSRGSQVSREAVPLVDEVGLEPVSGCIDALDTDVESSPKN